MSVLRYVARWYSMWPAAARLPVALAALFAAAGCVLGLAAILTPLPGELREPVTSSSLRVTDRDGNVIREVRADDGARARWVGIDACGDRVVKALVAAEDQRFAYHFGIDPWAIARAALHDARSFRIVSGASTLTMQLARTVRPHPHTFVGKFLEMALALRIEGTLDKSHILEQYLNRVGFGPNLRGIAAASQSYFDKPPLALSTAEAATLVGLVRGPSYYELTRHPERALQRRNRVLARMREMGVITREAFERASVETLAVQQRAPAFGAPHFVRGLTAGPLSAQQHGLDDALRRPVVEMATTLDPELQRVAEAAAARVPAELSSRHVTAAAVLVVENETGSVLAYVGSPDFFEDGTGGQNDGVRALRQPGSALKPFVYALAIEELGWTGATVLPDVDLPIRTESGDYSPRDYDEHTRGPVRLREALGNSLNIPAVWTAEQLTPEAVLLKLRAFGFGSLRESAQHYGPGLALGDGEVSLLDLVRGYATLARGGMALPLRFVRALREASGRTTVLEPVVANRLLPPDVCAQITDILRDHDARRLSFGEHTILDFDFDVAAKTGTSKGYRDNWVVGYTRDVTVGVWAGNFDGSPMSGTTGLTGAGPVFHTVMEAAMRGRTGQSLAIREGGATELRRVEVCALSGEANGPACPHRVFEWMPKSTADTLPICSFHERVRVDPTNGLRAGPGCGASEVKEVVAERFPPRYAAWAHAAGRLVIANESSPRCPLPLVPTVGDADALQIDVRDGARFAMDPDRPSELQKLEVQVVAPESVRTVRLRVDGREFASRGAPFAFSWPLEEGDHVVVAEADGALSSSPVHLHVRGL